MSLADRLAQVRERIEAAAKRAGRSLDDVTLVGVSKRKPAAAILEALDAGLDCFGENYVQEAKPKIADVRARRPDAARFHYIGRLQTNKARDAVDLFDVIECVDRERLAREIDRRAGKRGRTVEVLLQVDTSDEPQKGGVAREELPALLDACLALRHLRVAGLMSIPAATRDPEASRFAFARLRELRDAQHAPLPALSMGMSADFEVAIEEGATIIRVGTAIFGPREDP